MAEFGRDLCAREVKSGKNRKARSLKKLMEMDQGRKITRWIKFEYGNIMRTDDGVEHYPLFAASFADSMIPPTAAVPRMYGRRASAAGYQTQRSGLRGTL